MPVTRGSKSAFDINRKCLKDYLLFSSKLCVIQMLLFSIEVFLTNSAKLTCMHAMYTCVLVPVNR